MTVQNPLGLLRVLPHEFILIFLFGFGAIIGSFVSLLIYRLYHDEKGIVNGRSKCPHCGKVLHSLNLIPIFSWIIQGGKCKTCGKPIPTIYPLIELSFAILFALGINQVIDGLMSPWIFGIITFSLVLFWYDVWFMTVDRRISFPAIALAFITITLNHPDSIAFYLAGGAFGGLFYFTQYHYSKGKWVGFGDVELGIFMGLILGAKLFWLSLFGAYILGCAWILVLGTWNWLRKGESGLKGAKLPMGAFLMPSLVIFMLWGDLIWDWYWQLLII